MATIASQNQRVREAVLPPEHAVSLPSLSRAAEPSAAQESLQSLSLPQATLESIVSERRGLLARAVEFFKECSPRGVTQVQEGGASISRAARELAPVAALEGVVGVVAGCAATALGVVGGVAGRAGSELTSVGAGLFARDNLASKAVGGALFAVGAVGILGSLVAHQLGALSSRAGDLVNGIVSTPRRLAGLYDSVRSLANFRSPTN
ncbi:MAG: hypothetical protein KDD69_02810 [Bdellovibrionales bacterium]|nr:hypothetical protein [Bdellovibrionales bacterium]